MRVEIGDDGVLLYHIYGRQFPLDDRRVAVIEDLPKDGAFGELGPAVGARADRLARVAARRALGADERDLLARVGDSIRLQILHTLDYRHALANPGSADERRRGRELSRAIARDVPLARDLAANLLDTVDRLSPPAATPPPAAAPVPPAAGSGDAARGAA